MLYQILDGTISVGGELILSHFDFEIKGTEKIAIIGKNGAGKTTLLRLLAGELPLDRDEKRQSKGLLKSRSITVELLSQQPDFDENHTVEAEIWAGCSCQDPFDRERFAYEQEYNRLFFGLGFSGRDKEKRLSEFSGGQKTKIALIRLLLKKPDVLLLDEPTNHLDMETVEWLEQYLRHYEKAVVMVSHDRFFLDRTAQVIYEISGKKLKRYPGNYTHYREEKRKQLRQEQKVYDRQKQEEERLQGLIDRFKHKPKKAAFARAKKKQLERMEKATKPETEDLHLIPGEISPLALGSKWVLESEHLKLGYDKVLVDLTLRIRRGQKIGLLGANGVGKTTFLKTAAGLHSPLDGTITLGNHVTIGYFDQNSANIQSDKSVLSHFHALFPSMTEKEVRSILGAYLFGGRDAMKPVGALSGGEKGRLVLAELLQSRPNFLILDEPTNHMDINAKEVLELAFQAYTGTILFVSHDRYFIRQVADAVLIFENQTAFYYPFGYEHYLERKAREVNGGTIAAQIRAEDHALVAGMRAVPKAERHMLREISTQDAYEDWRLRLIRENLQPAELRYEALTKQIEAMEQALYESEGFWTGEDQWEKEGYQALLEDKQSAWEIWHNYCLEWMETYEQLGG